MPKLKNHKLVPLRHNWQGSLTLASKIDLESSQCRIFARRDGVSHANTLGRLAFLGALPSLLVCCKVRIAAPLPAARSVPAQGP